MYSKVLIIIVLLSLFGTKTIMLSKDTRNLNSSSTSTSEELIAPQSMEKSKIGVKTTKGDDFIINYDTDKDSNSYSMLLETGENGQNNLKYNNGSEVLVEQISENEKDKAKSSTFNIEFK